MGNCTALFFFDTLTNIVKVGDPRWRFVGKENHVRFA